MKPDPFWQRMWESADDFKIYVLPLIEKKLEVKVKPIQGSKEDRDKYKEWDQEGADAFYLQNDGSLIVLSSRINWGNRFREQPAFTFRYGLLKEDGSWDYEREYFRKLQACKSRQKHIMFPEMHVESHICKRGGKKALWSYMGRTKDMMLYIEKNLGDETKVCTFSPEKGESREVVYISVKEFAKHHEVYVIKNFGEL